ncbi:MAG: HD-GYP domain-containing protein [Cetobacterium sp.]|uniref:HD-GYP domain-containing protein n=1 Tax=Cetobacterium sp. TaxID=2071632 RepID=UPI003F36349C
MKSLYKKNDIHQILDEYKLDIELKRHMLRVSQYAKLLGELMCLEKEKIVLLEEGALLHDIGKQLIDKWLLDKPSKLTLEEFKIVQNHCKLGLKILNKRYQKKEIENIVLLHHEKWDGTGYPFGLKRYNIPIEARIVSVVDCYDALITDRIYKKKVSHEEAIEILKKESGKSFDPDMISIFEIFENNFKQILEKSNENKG